MISVIIPVYNVKEWLPACVDSLLAQTFTDWEGILVDDGSTDGSGDLCETLAAADARLRVLHRANGGLAAARNTGLRAATGEAVFFLDSDDTVPPDYLETLWSAFAGRDMVFSAMEAVWPDGRSERIACPDRPETVADCLRGLVYGRIPPLLLLSACNKLYRRAVLQANGLWQPERLRRGEDSVFNMQYLCCAKTAAATDTAYRYRRRAGSLMDRHPELIAPAQAAQLQALEQAAGQEGLLADADFCRHLSQYKTDAFFFGVYQITGAGLGRKRAAALLRDLLRAGIAAPADLAAARPRTLPWRALGAVMRIKSGTALLAWLVLAAPRTDT